MSRRQKDLRKASRWEGAGSGLGWATGAGKIHDILSALSVPEAEAGTLYRYRLDDDPMPYPDPASRFQPQGPHGPSQVIDPMEFEWTDHDWKGACPEGQVLYEMHIGTFTQEGTWEAACRELSELADTDITILEIMPVADFPGRFGWGYDGVNLFAPSRLYGHPDDFRRFVDKAHRAGLGVILDVVYNHLDPDGNYLWQFARDYFSTHYQCEWGDAINFDGPNCGPGLPPFYVPGAVRVGSTVTDVSSARRSAAESGRGHIFPNSAGVRYPNEL